MVDLHQQKFFLPNKTLHLQQNLSIKGPSYSYILNLTKKDIKFYIDLGSLGTNLVL